MQTQTIKPKTRPLHERKESPRRKKINSVFPTVGGGSQAQYVETMAKRHGYEGVAKIADEVVFKTLNALKNPKDLPDHASPKRMERDLGFWKAVSAYATKRIK